MKSFTDPITPATCYEEGMKDADGNYLSIQRLLKECIPPFPTLDPKSESLNSSFQFLLHSSIP